MSNADPKHLPLPSSYASLPFEQIKISHVPESSKEVTPIVVVTLNRPQKYNAFTNVLMRELEQAYQMFDVDDRVRCIVLTGAGRMFCAGADLDIGFRHGQEAIRDHRDGGGRVVLAMHRCRKPIIAAINGSAVGVGITQTLPCAIRIAYDKAKIGFVFARRGIVMEACSSFFLPKLVGMGRALHLVTTGSVYPANHPLFNGLFSETLDSPEKVLTRALELADEITKNTSTVSTNLMREMMYRNPGSAEGTHLLDSAIMYSLNGSKDNTEGTKAFLEKRDAVFTNTMLHDAPQVYPWWEAPDTSSRPKPEGYTFKPEDKIKVKASL